MLSTCIQYVFVFHSKTCYICDSRMVILGQLIVVVVEINSIMSGRNPSLYYTYINCHAGTSDKKQKLNRNNVVHHQTW